MLKITQDPLATGERWEDYQGVSFKLAGIDCEPYQIALERARRLISREDAGQTLANIAVSPADRREHDVQCDLLGRFIIRDWKGEIEDEKGPVSYSPEAASRLLKGNVALFAWVITQSAKIAKDEQKEAAETVEKR